MYSFFVARDRFWSHHRRLLDAVKNDPKQHEFKDFDLGYAYECMARALALCGDKHSARIHKEEAEKAAALIKGEKDKELFVSDLQSEPWFDI